MRLRSGVGVLVLLSLGVLVLASGCTKRPSANANPVQTAQNTPVATGACCAADGTCSVTTQANCQSPSNWQGAGSSCTPSPCPPPAMTNADQKKKEQDLADKVRQLQDAFFDFDKSLIRDDARDVLNTDGKLLVVEGMPKILLEGNCDERGTVEYNLALGQRRADAVKNYLIQYGVSPNNLSTISYGEEKPFAQGHDESAWKQNRRVHLNPQP